jgi:anti-anti-sigma factor
VAEPLGCPTSMVSVSEPSPDFGVPRRMVSTARVVVALTGELDIATRQVAYDACVASESSDIVVDLGAVSFMDCSGYGALMAARSEFQRRGGSLTLRNARGEPARLLLLIDEGHAAC